MEISFDQFQAVDMRVGRILEVEDFPEARKPAYKLKIDFGPEIGIRQSSAQLPPRYEKDELIGRQIVAVMNFPPLRIAGFKSEVLVLGAIQADDSVILLHPDDGSELGAPIA
ncbi:MAG: tRNA-binding protein [Sphaerobacteraceae bacterium]|nr:MAG: tRNA-binding protein [Sphaerobacteraceae bacterium]